MNRQGEDTKEGKKGFNRQGAEDAKGEKKGFNRQGAEDAKGEKKGFNRQGAEDAKGEKRGFNRQGAEDAKGEKRGFNRQGAEDAKEKIGIGSGRRREPGAEVDAIARVVVDAALEVHRALGPGFLEVVYEEALAVELAMRGVAFARQVPVALTYKDVAIGDARLDLVVAGCLVVELKATPSVLPIHLAQVLSYLKATGQALGLIINFNVRSLREGIRRVVLTR